MLKSWQTLRKYSSQNLVLLIHEVYCEVQVIIKTFGQNVALYIIIFPGFLYLAAASLKYYAAKYQPTRNTIESFLDQLGFPLNFIYAKNSRYNFVTTDFADASRDVLEYLMTVSIAKSRIEKYSFTVLMALAPLAFLVGTIRAENAFQMVSDGLAFIVTALSIVMALRFGHRLKHI